MEKSVIEFINQRQRRSVYDRKPNKAGRIWLDEAGGSLDALPQSM